MIDSKGLGTDLAEVRDGLARATQQVPFLMRFSCPHAVSHAVSCRRPPPAAGLLTAACR